MIDTINKLNSQLNIIYFEALQLSQDEFTIQSKYINVDQGKEELDYNTICFRIVMATHLIMSQLHKVANNTSFNDKRLLPLQNMALTFRDSVKKMNKDNLFNTMSNLQNIKKQMVDPDDVNKLLEAVVP